MKTRNRRTADGTALGNELARLCDDAEPRARLKVPDIPPRCNSCAFRAGPHVANGSPETLMDALKCAMEGVEFKCHEPSRKDWPCAGWMMMMLSQEDSGPLSVPWPFSDEGGENG